MERNARQTKIETTIEKINISSHSNHPSKLFDAIKDLPLGFFPKKFIDFLTAREWGFLNFIFLPALLAGFLEFFFFFFFLPLLQYFQKKIFKENSQERKKLILYCDSNRKIQNSDFIEEQEEKDLYILILIFASTLLFFPRNWNDKIKGKIFFFLHLWSFFLFFFFNERFLSKIRGKDIYIYSKFHEISFSFELRVHINKIYIQISGSGCTDGKRFGYTNNRKQRTH